MRAFKIAKFEMDTNLLYVVQNVSQHRTEEILCNLWEMSLTIINDALTHSRARQMNRKIKTFYHKDNRLPILIDTWSCFYESHDLHNPGEPIEITISVKFPRKVKNYNVDQIKSLYEERLEKSMGLTELEVTQLVDIEKPDVRLTRHLKGIL